MLCILEVQQDINQNLKYLKEPHHQKMTLYQCGILLGLLNWNFTDVFGIKNETLFQVF